MFIEVQHNRHTHNRGEKSTNRADHLGHRSSSLWFVGHRIDHIRRLGKELARQYIGWNTSIYRRNRLFFGILCIKSHPLALNDTNFYSIYLGQDRSFRSKNPAPLNPLYTGLDGTEPFIADNRRYFYLFSFIDR